MNEIYYKKIIEDLLALIDEGIYIVDSDGKGMFYNDAMAAMEKINMDDVVGKPFHKAFPGVPLHESTMYLALKKGMSSINKTQTYKNLYGKEITTVNSTRPVLYEGKTIAAVEVAKDITNIRTMSDTILKLQGGKEEAVPDEKPVIKKYEFDDIIGKNIGLLKIIERAKQAAKSNVSVFIYGETGTGKELMAQSIHYASKRKKGKFLAQNCAALPEALLEGILFGTTKGGFTGAIDRAGLFEQANGGTLLLDEISAMPYELQSKILRVLQEDYIRRVGGSKDIPIDVRIIATVNEPAEDLIKSGKLRKDLYYRLNVVNVQIPPLRERKDDIPLLAEAFLEKHNKKMGKEIWMISDKAIKKLQNYDYPGNIRELENVVMQAISMVDKEHVINENSLQMPDDTRRIISNIEGFQQGDSLSDYIEDIEKELIREALVETSGNISKAAEALQLKRQTLQHKIKKYEMTY